MAGIHNKYTVIIFVSSNSSFKQAHITFDIGTFEKAMRPYGRTTILEDEYVPT